MNRSLVELPGKALGLEWCAFGRVEDLRGRWFLDLARHFFGKLCAQILCQCDASETDAASSYSLTTARDTSLFMYGVGHQIF